MLHKEHNGNNNNKTQKTRTCHGTAIVTEYSLSIINSMNAVQKITVILRQWRSQECV